MQAPKHLRILAQPDDITCGPTSLHAVYTYYGNVLDLTEVIASVKSLEGGGTLAVMLGIDALQRGFEATIYSYNLKMFDPDWKQLSNPALIEKLEQQLQFKQGKKFTQATRAYQSFLKLGGKILFEDLQPDLLKRYLSKGTPILTGLSATYLYDSTREYTNRKNQSVFDDLRGEPMGHFVVLSGMQDDTVFVADPYKENPLAGQSYYDVPLNRLLNAILLGIVTYDANMLIVQPQHL
ncbi:C39 family peptidase [Geofilum rhodophaeum]|uniref:C39 family peptidase n=1 Tax=Geofilum rhodophaeum TaxID=1965019 RepID=UPI000B5268C7|nr:C39 family peptidase [Geofilum rhodophaeum]